MTQLTDEEYKVLQKELDEKKYRQSEIAKLDMSGKMEYCPECPCVDRFAKICLIQQSSREQNCVCAKVYIRMKENKLL